ncbi:MAG: YfhO family protein [Bacteroidales bacterium]|nr:YfhO family protein [Bacteroidales bacterium]
MKNLSIKSLIPYLSAVIIFIILSLAYLSPVLEGKKLRQDDISRHKGMSKEIVDFREKTGEEALWTNSMFGGMPAYQISVKYKGNLIQYIDDIFRLGLPHPAGLVFLYMIGFFILLIVLKVDPWLSIAGAIAFGFSSYFFIILEAGHNSKAHAIGYMAPVIAGVILTYRGKYIVGGLLTLLFLALEIQAGHPQISYYLFLLLLIFGIVELVGTVKSKKYLPFIKSTSIILIAAIIAVLTHITNLWGTYEYGKYTIRGKSELTTDQENRTSGLDKDYATQWSYGVSESFSLLIPNIKGGATGLIGDKEYALKNVDAQYKDMVAGNANQYWGDQPFTSGPVYAGALIVFLFVYGLLVIKGRMKWWLLAGTILSIMLAWGKNFMPLTEFFLDYFPGYNKFRAVSMTMVIAELTIPLLAILALNKVLTDPSNFKQKIKLFSYNVNPFYVTFSVVAGLSLLFALFPSVFFNFLSEQEVFSIAQQKNSNPEYANQIADFYTNVEIARIAIIKADAFRSFIFILLGGVVIWAFSIGKLKKNYAIVLISVLILVDMWAVNKRYLNNENFVSKSKIERPYPKTAANKLILKDKDPNFRVLNLTVDPFADASTSFYHKSIGGYHGAKLRRYQELYDHQIKGKFNISVLNMLNTRYIIQPDDQNQASVIPNTRASGNAWFVEEVKVVKNADEELEALNDFDPETTAIVDELFSKYLDGFAPGFDSVAQIQLIDYQPNHLQYQSNTKKDQLVVFSEIYYDKGWNAYVDEEFVPHFRVNYVLRAMIVPAGEHKVDFKFEPKVYRVGEKISFASSLLVIFLILGYGFYEIRNYFRKEE